MSHRTFTAYPNRLNPHRRRTKRHGSALLICTIATAFVSLASIAILRSNQRGISRVDAIRVSRQGRHAADGLVQRSIAALRVNPNRAGTIVDPAVADARAELQRQSPNATRIQVFLFAAATVAARDLVVDPTAL